MSETNKTVGIEESTINSVTFTSSDTRIGPRTYIEIEPGYWRTLNGSEGVFSSHMHLSDAVNEYFADRFAGEDLPDYPGSGDGDGDGGGKGDGGGEPGPDGGGL